MVNDRIQQLIKFVIVLLYIWQILALEDIILLH